MDGAALKQQEEVPEYEGKAWESEEAPAEAATFEENDSPAQIPPSNIIAYNEFRSCADLIRMHKKGRLRTDPGFQREFVWNDPTQTRFIDSLIKALPIPSMCIALDRKANERIVIDGQQRISTIARFLAPGKESWRLSRLEDVDQAISGKTPQEIKETDPEYFDRVEEHSLPITVLDCDMSKESHMNYIFTIFHRLNRGGAQLNNQEIRNCIFGGALNRLLQRLDEVEEWRRLNHMEPGNKHRFKKQELILRFFAFFYQDKEAYKGGMARFLNHFMQVHRNEDKQALQEKEAMFNRTVSTFSRIFDAKGPKERIPANVLYPVMVGIAKNINTLEKLESSQLQERYRNLTAHEAFADQDNLASRGIVRGRLQTAEDIFGVSA